VSSTGNGYPETVLELRVSGVRCRGPKPPGPEGGAAPGHAAQTSIAAGGGGMLRCAACSAAITRTDARTEIGGAHEHAFMNPAGIAFRIGCFSVAPGCVGVGEEETYWSWFPGHAWRVAACRACRAHLGWSFRSAGASFHGLILDRLVSDARPG